MKRTIGSLIMLAACTFPLQAHAQVAAQSNPADEILACAESQFSDEQFAEMGRFFLKPEEEGVQRSRMAAQGRAEAFSKIGDAVSTCESMSGLPTSRLAAVSNYLKQLSLVHQIGFSNGAQWNAAMQNFAVKGVDLLPATDEVDEHTRAMIAAIAYSNNVPRLAADEDEGSAIIAYLQALAKSNAAKAALLQ